jgi:hypothetical protein
LNNVKIPCLLVLFSVSLAAKAAELATLSGSNSVGFHLTSTLLRHCLNRKLERYLYVIKFAVFRFPDSFLLLWILGVVMF